MHGPPETRPSQPPSDTPQLIDIPYEKQLMRRFGWGLLFVMLLPLVALGVVVSRSGGAMGPVPVLASALLMAASIALYTLYTKRRQRHVVDDLVAEAPGVSEAELIQLFIARRSGFRADAGVEALVKRLAAAGRREVTIRIGPVKSAVAVEPIRVPFEPCLLDEADAAMVELDTYTRMSAAPRSQATEVSATNAGARTSDPPAWRAGSATEGRNTAGGADGGPGRGDHRVTTASERWALRRFRRNMRVKGIGWFLIAIFAFNTVIAALESWQKGAVQWSLVYWPAFIVLLVYGPTRGGLFRGSQWLAVPGGLVVRKGATLGKQWTVHMFDRRRSVLVVFRNFREQWAFSVSDGTEAGTGIGTHREVTLLLRAWLSPLEPPGVERLSDLA